MIVVPNKFVFLATPRTGSRATSEALLRKYPDAITDYPSNHHDPAPDGNKLPVYTVIRHPVDQMLSWWYHVDVQHGSDRRPIQFAAEYDNVMFMPRWAEYRLNIHAEDADHFIIHGDADNVFELDDTKVVGRSEYKVSDTEREELLDYLEEEYHSDMYLWYKYNG